MILIVLWLLFAMLVGAFASGRGKSGLGFFLLSVLLSPLIGFIIALLAAPETSAAAALPGANPDFRAKWADLARYDADVSNAVDQLAPYGNEAVLRFRDVYSAVNDKAAIPAIVADIEAHAQSISDASGWAPAGFKKDFTERGVPIFKSGKTYWVAGEYFPDIYGARVFARQLAQAHRS